MVNLKIYLKMSFSNYFKILLVKPQFIIEPIDRTFNLNQEIELDCLTKGIPKPKTFWFKLDKNGKSLKIYL